MISKINGIPITTQFHAVDTIHKTPHQGIDLALPMDTPVHSIGYGVVTGVTNEGHTSFGRAVHMRLVDGNDVIYAHLDESSVHVGQFIDKGGVIGLSGNTGHSTGPHLHLQVMHNGIPIDPMHYLQPHTHPWWDLTGRVKDVVQEQLRMLIHYLIHGLDVGLEVIFPTAAVIGILWWMCPFFPKSDHAPKLTGVAMLSYMFLMLIKGSYGHG